MIKNNYVNILFITISVIGSIFIYGKYRCDNPDFKDPLQIKIPIWDLDGWSILHFFTFLYFGYLFPNYLFLAMIIGILWELFEFFYGYFKPTFLRGWGHCISTDIIDKDNNNIWWYGKISDLACNFTGFICGMYFRKLF